MQIVKVIRIVKLSCLLFILVCGFYFLRRTMKKRVYVPRLERYHDAAFAIKTSGCKIPKLDPWHPSVEQFTEYRPDLNCSASPIVIHFNGNKIHITPAGTQRFGQLNCSVRGITFKNDNSFQLGDPTYFTRNVLTTDEFNQVSCCDESNKVVHTEFHPLIFKKDKVEDLVNQQKQIYQLKQDHEFSVLLLGIDSMSKSHFVRHMRRTYTYLKKHFVVSEFHGFHRIDKHTSPNLIPFLTGLLAEEFERLKWEYTYQLPLIWRSFKSRGYRTLFAEDLPIQCIFNTTRELLAPPVDYYLRPFTNAVETFKNGSKIPPWLKGCVNHQPESELILKWVEDFLDAYPDDPLFSFTFLSRLSQNDSQDLSYHDKPILKFLQRLRNKRQISNTILFFFSGRGYGKGVSRHSYTGLMETKLPFMFIIVPRWFPKKYPRLYANLKTNERRLVTGLDMHATLRDLLTFSREGKEVVGRGRNISVLRYQIPKNRTCKDASIKSQICACRLSKLVAFKHNTQIKQCAQEIIRKINSLTQKRRNLCAQLSLETIIEASKLQIDFTKQRNNVAAAIYLVRIRALPGMGIFEGRVWHNGQKKYVVENPIERINEYGKQADCIGGELRQFCHCFKHLFKKYNSMTKSQIKKRFKVGNPIKKALQKSKNMTVSGWRQYFVKHYKTKLK